MNNEPSIWDLAKRSSSMRIGGGLVGLGVLFLVFVGIDALDRKAQSDAVMLWVAGFFALVGGLLVVHGARRGRAMWRLSSEGVLCEATVTAVKQSRFPTTVDVAPGWVIHYRYQDNLGQTHEGQSGDLTQEERETWKRGDSGTVRFDRARPDRAVWTGEHTGPPIDAESRRRAAQAEDKPPSFLRLAKRAPSLWLGPFFFVLGTIWFSAQLQYGGGREIALGVVMLVVLGLLSLAALRRVWIWHRLVRNGMAAKGTITAVKFALLRDWTSWRGLGVSEWQQVIRYCYEDDAGRTHHGWSGYLSVAEASRWRAGDPCGVRFDQERPGRSVWIGAVEGA